MQITIRDVPEHVRNELAARASSQGKSMQEYLRSELIKVASRPSVEGLLAKVRERKQLETTTLGAAEILDHRDAERR